MGFKSPALQITQRKRCFSFSQRGKIIIMPSVNGNILQSCYESNIILQAYLSTPSATVYFISKIPCIPPPPAHVFANLCKSIINKFENCTGRDDEVILVYLKKTFLISCNVMLFRSDLQLVSQIH